MVIAHFSPLKALGSVAFGYAMLALIVYLVTLPPDPVPNFYTSKPVLAAGLVAGILFAAMVSLVLIQLVLHQSAALWTDGPRLIYLNRWLLSAKREEITSAAVGLFGFRQQSIILTLRNERTKTIPVGWLREPAPAVLEQVMRWVNEPDAEPNNGILVPAEG